MPDPIKPILLVEDNVGDSLRLIRLLLNEGYSHDALVTAVSLREARAHLSARPFAFALVDMALPDGSGIDLIADLRVADLDLCILVLSVLGSLDQVMAALRAGASGYILKDRDDQDIASALRLALRGGAPIDPYIARKIIDELPPDFAATDDSDEIDTAPNSYELSKREFQILHLISAGLSNREIAARLHRSLNTIERHTKNIYRKFAVASRVQALQKARALGLLK